MGDATTMEDMSEPTHIQMLVLPAVVGLIAFLYSSVGHGGATGYLAAAALLGFPPAVARPGALWLNCIVAGIAFFRFSRAGFFDRKIFWSLAVVSIPAAWLGSRLHLEGRGYAYTLGGALFTAGWFLGWGGRETAEDQPRPIALPVALATGGGLGFLAGVTGLGGGVFLTPLLIFLQWAPAKVAGGVSALFIVVTSSAGLAGLGAGALIWHPFFISAVTLGAMGALLGTYYGVKRWRPLVFRRTLAIVLWIVSAKLFLTGK
ncbi:MAG TPA: sulfite exporter TauE/SafE family protein [Verrucomicrobiota bacterium]|nr:sulfite exporter TauE/SafE family protein [Verrucomicrobiota bacterium]HNT15435.1 sulfite exporter TauE/SafE family protein [Verrucomicrobiota bacterium]